MRRLGWAAAVAVALGASALLWVKRADPDPPPGALPVEAPPPSPLEADPRPQPESARQAPPDAVAPVGSALSTRVLVVRAGTPVAGATVSLGGVAKVTSAQGRVSYERCEPGAGEAEDHVSLHAHAGNLSSQLTEVDCRAGGGDYRLELRLAGTFQGQVLAAESRKPIPDAVVALSPLGAGAARTDGFGRYRLEGVPPGSYEVQASAPGRLAASVPRVEVESGRRRDVDLALVESCSVSGVVLGSGGEPLPGARVTLSGAARALDGLLGKARSGPDGRFRVEGLPQTLAVLTAEEPNHAKRTMKIVVPSENLQVALTLGARIEGLVRDHAGMPVVGAEVILSEGRDRPAGLRQSVTEEGGRYRFDRVSPGSYTLSAKAPLARSAEILLRVEGEAEKTVNLKLRPLPGVLSGRVVAAADGRPIAGALVTAGEETASTDRNGEFFVEGLEGDRVGVTATAAGFVSRGMGAAVGSSSLVIELPRPLKVKGRVLRKDGEPVHAFELCDFPAPALRNCEAVHTTDGRFLLQRDSNPALPGEAAVPALAIRAEGYRTQEFPRRGEPGETYDLGDVVLEDFALVVAHVTDPQDAPVVGARLFAGRGQRFEPIGTTDGNGEARFIARESGTTCVLAVHPAYASSTGCARVTEGESGYLAVRLSPAAWLVGTVLSHGVPAPGVEVADGSEGIGTVSGADGSFRLGPLRAGTHLPVAGDAWRNLEELSFRPGRWRRRELAGGRATEAEAPAVVSLGEGETKHWDLEVGCLTRACAPPALPSEPAGAPDAPR